MRILIRTSRWAIWSRRLVSLALPITVFPILMHRERLIESDTFLLLFLGGMGLAALAILFSLITFARLWHTGDQGWPHAIQALLLGLVLVSPIGFAAYLASKSPPGNDVATPGDLPPLLIAANPEANPLPPAMVENAFPNAVSRTYPVAPEALHELAGMVMQRNGWEIRRQREPVAPNGPGELNAIAMTWLGWRDEVAVRVYRDADGARITMRSASLTGPDDLGTNGRRIEAFLLALDAAVTEYIRTTPIVGPAEETGE